MMIPPIYFGIFLIIIINLVRVWGFVFESEGRHRIFVTENPLSPVRTRRPIINVSPNTIDSIFQIPIAVIQGTSAAAQSFSPENGDAINKVFDIPVQTLQAVGNLVKDQIPQQSQNQNLQNRRKQRQTKIYDQHGDNLSSRRRHHSSYDGWTSAFVGLLIGGHGHGGLWGNSRPSWGGHGGHENFLGHSGHFGHKKKKKKKKHGHGGHGQFVQQILGGDDNIYQVNEDIDDAVPQGIFSWQSSGQSQRIQNKIAPGFNYHGRATF